MNQKTDLTNRYKELKNVVYTRAKYDSLDEIQALRSIVRQYDNELDSYLVKQIDRPHKLQEHHAEITLLYELLDARKYTFISDQIKTQLESENKKLEQRVADSAKVINDLYEVTESRKIKDYESSSNL